MILYLAVVIVQQLDPSSLPHIQLLLVEYMLEARVICEDRTFRTIKVVSPDLQSENHCAKL
ncbi:hypothetical protein Hanom_Chr12g01132261 [Helianthus anomalus]